MGISSVFIVQGWYRLETSGRLSSSECADFRLSTDCRPIVDSEENLGLGCCNCICSTKVGEVRGSIAFLLAFVT